MGTFSMRWPSTTTATSTPPSSDFSAVTAISAPWFPRPARLSLEMVTSATGVATFSSALVWLAMVLTAEAGSLTSVFVTSPPMTGAMTTVLLLPVTACSTSFSTVSAGTAALAVPPSTVASGRAVTSGTVGVVGWVGVVG